MKKIRPTLINLLALLNDGKFHGGGQLGSKLNISRAAIWKLINQLKTYGIHIQAERGKGYCLLTPTVLLDEASIKRTLENERYKVNVEVFSEIDSTNSYLQRQQHISQISLCMAEQQTHGRGRLHRVWSSPFAQNLYYSCAYPFCQEIGQLSGLSLLVSLVVVKTLNQFGINDHLQVKWPNDVLYQGKKISGALIELSAEAHGDSLAIIGIGINVNMLDDGGVINQPWTSMQAILGGYVDRNLLSVALTKTLITHLQAFTGKGFAHFVKLWSQHHCLHEQSVIVHRGVEKISGVVKGVDDLGRLLLQDEGGRLVVFSSGEVSVRKTMVEK